MERCAGEIISEFLSTYETDRMAQRVRPRLIAKYVDQCTKVGELGSWTVCLVGSTRSELPPHEIAGHTVGLVRRGSLNPKYRAEGRYTIRRVLSPPDEMIGLDPDQKDAARKAAERAAKEKETPKTPAGPYIRRQRRTDQGLLLVYPIAVPDASEAYQPTPLVGFQLSFPHSEYQSKTEYEANSVWLQEDIYTKDEEDDA